MSTETKTMTLKDLSFSELIQLRDHFDEQSGIIDEYRGRDEYEQSCLEQMTFIDKGILARFIRIKNDSIVTPEK